MSSEREKWLTGEVDSYSAGERASEKRPSSRVRIFTRSSRDGIYMECAWIRTSSGRPRTEKMPADTSRKQALRIAEEAALERKLRILKGTPFEQERRITLGELTDDYHGSKRAYDWSDRHRAEQERCRDFWLQELGERTVVQDLTPAEVQRIAGEAARRKGWSARTQEKYLKYLTELVRWGHQKARKYDTDPLRGVDYPKVTPDTSELIYSREEARKLLASHEKVDWRVTLAANIACDTGRRLSAIRRIRKDDLRMVGERLVIHFQKESDKGRRGMQVPVSDQTARLVADALDREDVQKSEHLFPAGRVGYDEHHDKPITAGSLIEKLHKAEDALGIERVKNRGFHGLKRLHVTLGFEVSGGDEALVGDVTGNVSPELLRNVYRQQDRDRMTRHVDAVREELEEADDGRT